MVSASLLTASRQHRDNGDSRSEKAYRSLKEKIVRLELPPASLLNETQLMHELKLGRTPIREALQRLAFENLVVILPRRGTIVADLNVSDLQKTCEVRLELETLAVRLATERATTAQIAQMEALFANVDQFIERDNHDELIRLDQQAHTLIAQATQNEFLAEILERLYTQMLRLWYISLNKVVELPEALKEHQEIVAAIKTGDGEQAAQIMRAHILNFQEAFMAAL